MTVAEAILKAIKTMPSATEVWLHSKYQKEDFSGLAIKVKFSPMIPHEKFFLSEKDMTQEIQPDDNLS